jgi:hypothetical protein
MYNVLILLKGWMAPRLPICSSALRFFIHLNTTIMRSVFTNTRSLNRDGYGSPFTISATGSFFDFGKRNLKRLPVFAKLCCLALGLMCSILSWSQTPTQPSDCKTGCTSNDVQIKSAYLVDPVTGQKLDASFQCQGTVTVKLALELTTKTPRVGVVIYANIKDFTGGTAGTILSTPSECFGITLNQPTNKVVFQQTFSWSCGTPIVLTDVFIGWGTGNTNFCTGSGFQCPATSSKCYSLPPGQYITIQVPTGQGASQTKCSTNPGGTTAVFDLTASDNTIKNGQTGVHVRWYSDAAGTNELTGTNKTAFTNTSNPQTVYAKVCNDVNTSVCSGLQSVVLTVKTTPGAPTLGKIDNCDGTSTITATGLANGATLTWSDGGSGNPRTVSSITALAVTQTVNGCTSAASNSVTPAPGSKPVIAAVTVTQAPSCSSSTVAVTVTPANPDANNPIYEYKNGNGNWQTSNVFTFKAGEGYSIQIRSKTNTGCISDAAVCAGEQSQLSTTNTQLRRMESNSSNFPEVEFKVTAYPNPFHDQINFVVTSPVEGKGSLDVYNALGQKIKTVYQGKINKGAQNFELRIPTRQQANLIYILRVGDQQLTGKLLQLNR